MDIEATEWEEQSQYQAELIRNQYKQGAAEFSRSKVPVYKGCPTKGQCFCTGTCRQVIGYRDKLPGEN